MSDKSYYEAVAQVIPILLLTMAIGEARLRVRDTLSLRTATLGALFTGAILLAGEVAALRVLKVGHDTRLAKDLTAIGLGVGFAWIVRNLASLAYRDREGADEPPTEIAVLIDLAFAVTALAISVALIL